MGLPIYELLINENESSDLQVDYIAIVDAPAIEKDFMAFKDEFIEPSASENKDDFLDRCISYVINEGKEDEQAIAICNSLWEQHFAEESFDDYPKEASENAKIALRYAEENGWGDCGTPVGKARANQLAKGEKISKETISRMASFERHRQNSQKELGDGCGRLMWLAWGGDAGIEWASKKLAQLNKFVANKISIDYDDTLSTDKGKELARKLIDEGNTLYIISARDSKDGMLQVASDLNIPESRVYATGSNTAKVEKVKELGISQHIDNNQAVIDELGSLGKKFTFQAFAIVSEDRRIISGPAMLANVPIFRSANGNVPDHYVVFKAPTIYDIAQKFIKKGFGENFNLMHDSNQKTNGVSLFESFIVDSTRGILPMKGFEDAQDGSWFISAKVDDEALWQRIKSGEFRGFSVEGLFQYKKEKLEVDYEAALEEIKNILNM